MNKTSLTRRHFLGVSLATAAGLALRPALAATSSTAPPPKWGVCQGLSLTILPVFVRGLMGSDSRSLVTTHR